MRKILIILLLICSVTLQATKYYVSASDGDDGDTGLTPALAWATLTKVNASSFSAGDSILFNRGDEWRGRLIIPSSGEMGSPIVFGTYGTGVNPIFNSTTAITGWTLIEGDKYVKSGVADIEFAILINEVFGTKKADVGSVIAQNDWFWDDADGDKLYIYSSDMTLIERPSGFYAIYTNGKDHLKITNINAKGGAYNSISVLNSEYVIIDSCVVYSSQYEGINVVTSSNYTISNNIIRDNGNDGIYLGPTSDNGEIYGNEISGNGITTDNPDRQAIGLWISRDINIHDNNITHNPTGTNVFCLEFTSDVDYANRNIRFYRNKVKASNCSRIISAFEGDYYIENNELIGDGSGYGIFTGDIEIGEIHLFEYNNTIDSTTIGIVLYEDGYTPAHIDPDSRYVVKNNIIANASVRNIHVDPGLIGQVTINNNLYDDDTGTKFRWNATNYNFANWKTNSGQDANSIIGDPLFRGGTNYFLQSDSPAINAGVDVGLTIDLYGHKIPYNNTLPDIGAYEWGRRKLMNNGKLEMLNGKIVIIEQ